VTYPIGTEGMSKSSNAHHETVRGGGAQFRPVVGLALIALAGILGQGAIAAMLSGHLFVADPGLVAQFVAFLQFHAIALTIVKYGADQVVFAVVSGNHDAEVPIRKLLVSRFLPMLVGVGFFAAFLMPIAILVCFLLAVLFDSVALCRGAQHVARGSYLRVATAAFANNPLFILLLIVLRPVSSLEQLCALFLLTTLARYALVVLPPKLPSGETRGVVEVPRSMLLQQVMNWILHRGDSLWVSAVLFLGLLSEGGDLRYVLFCGKVLEIAGSLLSLLGILVYPRLFWDGRGPLLVAIRQDRVLWLLMMLGLGAGVGGAQLFWQEGVIGGWWTFAALAGLLLFPVNLLTYSLLRQERLHVVLRALGWAVGSGFVLGLLTVSSPRLLLVVVPVQFLVFIGVILIGSRAERAATPSGMVGNERGELCR
jgi:hypothetical protein